MRRSLKFVLLVVLAVSLPVLAQRGGGGGFSGHGSVGGGHSFSGGAVGGYASSGSRGQSGFVQHGGGQSFAGRSFAGRSFSGHTPYSHSALNSRNFASRGSNRSTGLRLRTYGYGGYGYGNRCGGLYGCGYPFLGGAFDPYWWWDSSAQDQDRQEQIGLANEMNQQSLEEQRQRQAVEQDFYAKTTAPPAPHQPERTVAAPATVLIFRDQRKQEIQNYAIIGQTLWNFAPQRTEKIALSDLDLPATAKENDERGVDFRLPMGSEGQ